MTSRSRGGEPGLSWLARAHPTQASPATTGTADDRALIAQALAGDRAAMQALVDRLLPVVQRRVAVALGRWRGQARGRPLAQEVDDLVQEAFAALFEREGRALRGWQPERGLSLASFVGLVAEREAGMILRTGRRSPFTEEPTGPDALELRQVETGAGGQLESRDLLRVVIERLRDRLSPQGYFLFELLFVEECAVEDAAALTGLSVDALYAWRSRIARLSRQIHDELVGAADKRPAGPAERRPHP